MNPTLVLRILAALVAIRAVTNFFKAGGGNLGFVLFGWRLGPTASMIFGPAFAIFMLVYVWAAWTKRSVALPLGIVYAVFATLNIVLFPFVTGIGEISPLAYLGFSIVGIGVSWGMVLLLRSMYRELQ
ncbi:MAG TPA: hypothetical protein VEC57_11160 [Candidatus Limnocylindrales bacterium]|nr:hypothetical protein [Candidatus Limnocylindrales bacterium]